MVFPPLRTLSQKINSEYGWSFLFFLGIFWLSNSGYDTSEGSGHYLLAEHIVRTGRLGYSPLLDAGSAYRPGFMGPNGNYYIPHEIGNTLFLLPTAAFNLLLESCLKSAISLERIADLQRFVVAFQPGVYMAITATALLAILRVGFQIPQRTRFLLVNLTIFTSFLWPYSRSLYDGVLCTMLLSLAFLGLLHSQGRHSSRSRDRALLASAVALGLGLITRLSMVIPVIASLAYLVVQGRCQGKSPLPAVKTVILTLIPFSLWQLWYNALRTGSALTSPVQTDTYANNNGLDGNWFLGVFGLLASPGKSVFLYVPLLLLSVLVFGAFYRRHRPEAIYLLILGGGWLALHAKLQSWYGAWGWGPRHFVPLAIFLSLPALVEFQRILGQWSLRIPAITAVLWGLLLEGCAIISNWHFRLAYAREQGRDQDAFFVWGWPQNQAIDMVQGGLGNLHRLLTGGDPLTITSEYSPANEYVSSTLSLWPNVLIAIGVPWPLALTLALPLVLLVVWSASRLWQSYKMS
ncbi:MAG: hypothetical protein Fur0042_20270 [Cyanophyceae cyanobacterium]